MASRFTLRNSSSGYGLVAIGLHWLMALAIIGMYPLGLYIETLDYYDPNYRIIPHWHKSIGLLLAITLCLRLGWRIANPRPAPLPQHKPWEQRMARITHHLLYLLMACVFAAGYLISTADGRAIEVFNWFTVPALPPLLENQEDVAGELHYWLATGLVSLASLHALAALKHHFIDRDGTLRRMLKSEGK